MYKGIYRDFRPDNFDHMIGQNHIVRILKNQIASGTVGHAYLLCGTRGTGKTTTARILAKAINCRHEDPAARPCCECESCRAIKEGRYIDVIEIDAASNNSVEDIRDLREGVNYAPVMGQSKVYIIDEVHMLSAAASNALLKTLEEPPENVYFILATTDPHKLLATILSRCIRLDFRRVSEDALADNMRNICNTLGVKADDAALYLIAANADGSVRDSLSLLDQCISAADGELGREDVVGILGMAGEAMMINITECVLEGDIAKALIMLDAAIKQGVDVKLFMKEWLAHFRNLLMAKFISDAENMLNMSLENAAKVKEQAGRVSAELLNLAITELTKTISESRWSAQPRVILEMCLVRIGMGPQEKQQPAASPIEAAHRAPQKAPQAQQPSPVVQATVRTPSPAPSVPQQAAQAPQPAAGGAFDLQAAAAPEELPGLYIDVSDAAGSMAQGSIGAASPAPEDEAPAAQAAEPQQNLAELWRTVVRKASGEKLMLVRAETKAMLVKLDENNFYVGIMDDMTEKVIKENGREVLERWMSEYCGRHMTLRLVKQKGVPLAKDSDSRASESAETVAEQMKEKFHVDVEIRP